MAMLDGLAKPVGSLGTLEDWAARVGALQRRLYPSIGCVRCLIFAGDHGMARAKEEGGEACSAFPQGVTGAICDALEGGTAAASVLARANGVDLAVVDVGVLGERPGPIVKAAPEKLPTGTRNACR